MITHAPAFIPWELHEEARRLGMDAEELHRQREEVADWVKDDDRRTPMGCSCADPWYRPGDARCGMCGGLLGRSDAERAAELMFEFGLWT